MVPQQAVQVARGPAQFDGRRKHFRRVRKIADFGFDDLIGAQEHLDPQPPVRTDVDCGLHQTANQEVHRLRVVGAAIQSVEQHQKIGTLVVELGVALLEQAVDLLRIIVDVPYAVFPRGVPSERMVVWRKVPRLNRPPDRPRLHAVVQQAPQHVLARMVFGRRLDAESRSHLGVPAQRGTCGGSSDQSANAGVLQRTPPEGLAGAAHAGDDQRVGVHRLDVGRRQVHAAGRRRLAVARSSRQRGERFARPRDVDCARHGVSSPRATPSSNHFRNAA